MFGTTTLFSGEKVLLALWKKEENRTDNGIWVATKAEHHAALKTMIPELQAINVYKIKTWLLLHEDEELFEERLVQIADLIKSKSPLIGNVSKAKKKKAG